MTQSIPSLNFDELLAALLEWNLEEVEVSIEIVESPTVMRARGVLKASPRMLDPGVDDGDFDFEVGDAELMLQRYIVQQAVRWPSENHLGIQIGAEGAPPAVIMIERIEPSG